MSKWLEKNCQAGAGSTKVTTADAFSYLTEFPEWEANSEVTQISRRFLFKNFKQTMFFMNAVAFVCEREVHHPDVKLGFNYCELTFTTHDVNGLSENDFICAAKVNQLLGF